MTSKQDSLKTLSLIAQIIQKSGPSENPLAHIVMMVRDEMKVDVCSLYLLQGKDLILVASDGLDTSSVGKVRMGIHEGLTGLAVEKLQPVIVKEASNHPRFKYFPETGEEKFQTFAAVPLMDRQEVVGVLTIQTTESRELTPQEIELLKLIAFQLAGVVQNLVTLEMMQCEEGTAKRSLQFRGVPVAPGFGIGPACFLYMSRVSAPLKGRRKNPQDEWKKLKNSIQKASQDLLKMEKKLMKRFSRSESDIFYSHRMMLSDKSFLKKIFLCQFVLSYQF